MLNISATSDWITLIGVVVTFFGVLVSGFFSFLLYRATKESTAAAQASAEAAKLTVELANNSEKDRKIKELAMRQQLKVTLRKQALQALENLSQMNGKKVIKFEDPETIKLRIEPSYLALYFSDNERKIINEAWANLDEYFFNYWRPNLVAETYELKSSLEDPKFLEIHDDLQKLFSKLINDSFLNSVGN